MEEDSGYSRSLVGEIRRAVMQGAGETARGVELAVGHEELDAFGHERGHASQPACLSMRDALRERVLPR